MGVLVNKDTKLVVQEIAGKAGSFHATQCFEYGPNIVAGVTPFKGGQTFMDQVPIVNSVNKVVQKKGVNTSVIFVPPPFAADTEAIIIDRRDPRRCL